MSSLFWSTLFDTKEALQKAIAEILSEAVPKRPRQTPKAPDIPGLTTPGQSAHIGWRDPIPNARVRPIWFFYLAYSKVLNIDGKYISLILLIFL